MSVSADYNPVEQLIIPRTADLGGFEVHRALPSRARRMVGPFIFWDQMGPGEFLNGQGLDVRPHPHIGLATVTYLFEGTLDHKDSLGSDQRIRPGDVNVMKAGKGITHSERTGQDIRKNQPVHTLFGIQSWIALPKNLEESEPEFEHIGDAALPIIEDGGIKTRLIMGEAFGKKSPVKTFSDTFYAEAFMKEGDQLPVPDHHEERAIYALSGQLEIGGQIYQPNQILILKPKDKITVKAKTAVHLMLFGGATMDGERYIDWNFVHSDPERIQEAKKQWVQGEFKMVPGDEEYIPLP